MFGTGPGFTSRGSVHLTPGEGAAAGRAVARLVAWLLRATPWPWMLGIAGALVLGAVVLWGWYDMVGDSPSPSPPLPEPTEGEDPQDAAPPDWMEDQ